MKPTAAAPRRSKVFENLLAVLLLIAAPMAALWPVCTHGFLTYDDVDQVQGNPTFNPVTGQSVVTWWTSPRLDMYAPVTYSVWGLIALEAYEPGASDSATHLEPAPFHVASVVVHVLCGLVVFALLRMLIGDLWPAVIGALLFELHPVQVEAVAWMSELNTVLSTLLALLAIWQYLLAARGQQKIRAGVYDSGPRPPPLRRHRNAWRWHYAAALLLYALAMLAKPAAIVTPLIAAILDVLIIGRSWRQAGKWLWPWAVLAVGCGLEAVTFQSGGGARSNVAWYLRPMVAMDSVAFYVEKIFWPVRLVVDYGLRPEFLLHDHWLIFKCVLVTAGVVALGWVWRRKKRASLQPATDRSPRRPATHGGGSNSTVAVAGGILFLVALLPVLGLVTFDFQWYSNVSDHYLYLPMFGVAMIAAWVCRRWGGAAVYTAGAVSIAALGLASRIQAGVWENTWTVFTYNRYFNPGSALVLDQFTRTALDDREWKLAVTDALQEIGQHPEDQFPYRVAGIAYEQMHLLDKAAAILERGLQQSPNNPLTLEVLAGVRLEQRRFAEAEVHARRAVAVAPDSAEAHFHLAQILRQEPGKLTEAIGEAQRAVQLEPGSRQYRQLLDHLRGLADMGIK